MWIRLGDSGEKDPEVYATMREEYPVRGKAEYIHLVTLERADSCRFQHAKAFHDWSEAKDDAAARHINATNSGWPEQQGPRP